MTIKVQNYEVNTIAKAMANYRRTNSYLGKLKLTLPVEHEFTVEDLNDNHFKRSKFVIGLLPVGELEIEQTS